MATKISDEDFILAWRRAGNSPIMMQRITGLSERQIYRRRQKLALAGAALPTIAQSKQGDSTSKLHGWRDTGRAYKRQNDFEVIDGHVIVFSDAHFWPGQPKSIAHEALLKVIADLKPRVVVANGDIFDGARVTRHDKLGWSELPSVKQELEICDEYLHEIYLTADPKRCAFFWNVGNHDMRFDRLLASNASEYEGVVDRLEDKFHNWDFAWSLAINGNVMVKHRYANGVHAAYNNTLKSGWSIVTGHLHRLIVTPWADYNGRRWGIDTGTLSDPLGPQFDYAENNPSPHTSGFAVLTFKDGRLLPPELCEVIDDVAYFRGAAV